MAIPIFMWANGIWDGDIGVKQAQLALEPAIDCALAVQIAAVFAHGADHPR